MSLICPIILRDHNHYFGISHVIYSEARVVLWTLNHVYMLRIVTTRKKSILREKKILSYLQSTEGDSYNSEEKNHNLENPARCSAIMFFQRLVNKPITSASFINIKFLFFVI